MTFAVGLLFSAGGVITLVGSWGASLSDTRIQRTGTRSLARVTDKTDLGTDLRYRLSYVFSLPGGQPIPASHHVSEELWVPVKVGDPIEVAYSPSRPARNFPVGEGVWSLGLTIFGSLLGGVFALLGTWLLYGTFRGESKPRA